MENGTDIARHIDRDDLPETLFQRIERPPAIPRPLPCQPHIPIVATIMDDGNTRDLLSPWPLSLAAIPGRDSWRKQKIHWVMFAIGQIPHGLKADAPTSPSAEAIAS